MSHNLLYLFGLIMSFFFILSVFLISKNKRTPFVENAPSLLTTLGILGTFVGITTGLINFDFSTHDSIDKSIPYFLDGLKLAFLTSVFGISCSICIKLFMSLKNVTDENISESYDFERRFFNYCENNLILLNEIKNIVGLSNENMKELKKSISGDGDSSVVTQLQKMRSDFNDHHNSHKKNIEENFEKNLKYFDGIYKKLNENNTQNKTL